MSRSKFVFATVAIILAVSFVFAKLNDRANRAIETHNQNITVALPSPSPTKVTTSPSSTPTPTPTPPRASKFITELPIYPGMDWVKMANVDPTSLSSLADYPHQSYTGWQAKLVQSSGQANKTKYFDRGIIAAYERELTGLNWTKEDTADGVTGAVRKFTGVKGGESQELIIEYSVSSRNGCGSGSCVCPCDYSYSAYLSSVDRN